MLLLPAEMPVESRDVVVQLKPKEAEIILRCLRATQDVLEAAGEFLPSSPPMVEERSQELSKLRSLMHRVRNAPMISEYVPREIGGVFMARAESGKIVAWGPNMEHICGWAESEMGNIPAWQILGMSDVRTEAFMEELKAEMVLQMETLIPTKWGKSTRVFMRVEYVVDAVTTNHTDHFVMCHIWPV